MSCFRLSHLVKKNMNVNQPFILFAIVVAFFISSINVRADYQSDQDIQKAAQQLKDQEDAQKAADERDASRKRYGGNDDPHYNNTAGIVIMSVVCAGVAIWFFASIANIKKR